jgi:predicted protein tyrosine phosphatase
MSYLDTSAVIHHVCGLDELADAPLERAARIVSIIDGDESPLAAVDRPLLVLRFDDVLEGGDGLVLPNEGHIRELLDFDAGGVAEDRLVIHCTAGISRSTAALAILLARRHPDCEDDVFAVIRSIRPQAWPNSLMIGIGDATLGLNGTLVDALSRHYAVQLARRPDLAQEMIDSGREREVSLGRRLA